MRCKILAAVAVLCLAAPLSSAGASLDYRAIAERIARQMALQPGERVLLVVGSGEFEELLPHLRYAVMEAGGVDLGAREVLVAPEGSDQDVLARGQAASLDALTAMFRDVDLAVLLPGAAPWNPEYAAMSAILREGRGRTIHFHWRGQDPFRSAIAVAGHPLPPDDVIGAIYQRALLDADYEAIGRLQRRFEKAMRSGEVRVTTPLGTDVHFRIGERAVNRQDGDASAVRAARARIFVDRDVELPCGAIRVAPMEESVSGVIAFPPASWGGDNVEGLKLRFERGRVVDMTATSGLEGVEREMEEGGPAARAFREFGLGFHPGLAVPTDGPWIPYYGYGAGVVRLSLGNNQELGGAVEGGYVRWNFFVDATVTVDGKVWVRDGRLTSPPRT